MPLVTYPLTKKQLKVAGKVLDERLDIRVQLMQLLHMSTTIQRILRHLRLPDEPIAHTYEKFAETFKIEVSERWQAQLAKKGMSWHHSSSGSGRGQGSMGPGNRGSGHGRDAYHDADYPLRNPSPMTTELAEIEHRGGEHGLNHHPHETWDEEER